MWEGVQSTKITTQTRKVRMFDSSSVYMSRMPLQGKTEDKPRQAHTFQAQKLLNIQMKAQD